MAEQKSCIQKILYAKLRAEKLQVACGKTAPCKTGFSGTVRVFSFRRSVSGVARRQHISRITTFTGLGRMKCLNRNFNIHSSLLSVARNQFNFSNSSITHLGVGSKDFGRSTFFTILIVMESKASILVAEIVPHTGSRYDRTDMTSESRSAPR